MSLWWCLCNYVHICFTCHFFFFFNFDSRRIDWRAYPEAIFFFFISVFKYKQFLTFFLLLFGVTLQAKIFLIYV